MTPERFADLAQAYGGDLGRWPTSEREAASAWLEAHPHASATLAEAGTLDALLGSWRVSGPGSALAAAIMTAASTSSVPVRHVRRWLSSAGATAALLGGLAAGAACAALVRPDIEATRLADQISVLGAPLDVGQPSGATPE